LVTVVGFEKKNRSKVILLKMSRPTTRLASTSRTGTETDTTDVPSRTREEGLYEMIVSMANKLKNINKRWNKDREEFLTRMKEQERKGFDAASLIKDIQLLAQQITELKSELCEKDAVTPPDQREIINHSDIPLLENCPPT